jgi:hypothetical protein
MSGQLKGAVLGGADRAVSEASRQAAPGQSMEINIIPEKLAAAKVVSGEGGCCLVVYVV